jgi:hypothetical protein
MKSKKVPVNERALLKRVNRKLEADLEVVRKSRPFYDGERPYYDQNTGMFYRVDLSRNFLVESDVNLEELAREIGALKTWEQLAPEAP